ncbi:IPT/TIG domain-containing protein [Pedobacter aquae]|nr:IPT/TIG domain-containing protein [Pedobacter aquae]
MSYKHDSSQPVRLDSFSPLEGSRDTEIIVYGNNFSSNPRDIIVTINNMRATVHEAYKDKLVITVPNKSGSGKIKISIAGREVESTVDFNYIRGTLTVRTLAGTGLSGYKDGSSSEAQFNFSIRGAGIVTDTYGNVFVADVGNHAIRKITPSGLVSTFAGNGTAGSTNGIGNNANFYHPYGLAIDAQNNLYVADTWNWQIRKITPQGEVSIFAGIPNPCGITVDKRNGDVFSISYDAGIVYRFSRQGDLIEQIRVNGTRMLGDIEVDSKGNLYVVDNYGCNIEKLNAGTWEKSRFAGSTTYGFLNGPGNQAQFASPWGIGIDVNDNLYIGGTGDNSDNTSPDHTIRFINGTTKEVSSIAGAGKGFANGTISRARFSSPADVAVDPTGIIYVLDRNNHCIRKISLE